MLGACQDSAARILYLAHAEREKRWRFPSTSCYADLHSWTNPQFCASLALTS
jgi:hypothetical protein